MEVVSYDVVQKYNIFSIGRLVVRAREPDKTHTYHIIERPDSVQVVAVTADGQLLLVEQERQASRQLSLEFVAGLIDKGETPAQTAARELEEETGYRAAELHELGWYYTDPAVLTNRVTVFLAEGCVSTGRKQPDEGEEVHTRLLEPSEMDAMIADGRITHALCISAWHLYQRRVQRSRSRT